MKRRLRPSMRVVKCKKGSMGIESILWASGFLMFLVMPVLCLIYEHYAYSLEGLEASNALAQTIESIQYHVSTEALSEARVVVNASDFEDVLKATLINRLKCDEKTRQLLEIKVSYHENTSLLGFKDTECIVLAVLGIRPSTFVGALMADPNGLMPLKVESRVAMPINQ